MGLGRYSGAEEPTDSKPSAFLEMLPANAQALCSASRTECLAYIQYSFSWLEISFLHHPFHSNQITPQRPGLQTKY